MAREGFVFLIPSLLACFLFIILWKVTGRSWLLVPLILVFVFAVFTRFFFRDPQRTPPDVPRAIISAADGRICLICETKDPFSGLPVRQVSTFMSPFNVHVNRAPFSGQVVRVEHKDGTFTIASHDKASEFNEQTYVALQTAYGPLAYKQIAGMVARRIRVYLKPGELVRTGQKVGMIQFGSRVDLLLPLETELKVKVGDKVHAGETVIAEWPPLVEVQP